ncbi:MAG: RNA-binding domain-containing protein [Methanobacteriaceae archaeon]|nr:RNA-binding domain-containing protein [Methanobacteriaceae archaeon]
MKTKINPTENPLKIKNAIKNILPENQIIKEIDNELILEASDNSIDLLHDRILNEEKEKILESILLNKLNSDCEIISFFINKQAAYNNELNILDEELSPLNDIEIILETDYLEEFIKYLTR